MRYLASPAQLRASLLRWSLFDSAARARARVPFQSDCRCGAEQPLVRRLGQAFALSATGCVRDCLVGARCADGRVAGDGGFGARRAGAWPSACRCSACSSSLNLAWSPVFFALHQMTWALAVIGAMIVLTGVMLPMFSKVRPVAAALLLPYFAWICFAALLNYQFLELTQRRTVRRAPAQRCGSSCSSPRVAACRAASRAPSAGDNFETRPIPCNPRTR